GSDPNDFISGVISNLNTGNTGGQTFENNISTDQQTSWVELSQSVNGVAVYNFAVAKVRYRSLVLDAQNVRVFFRLFPASSTSLEFDQTTTYRRAVQGSTAIPLLGIISGETVTIPCFASPRIDSSSVSMTQQTDAANVQTIPQNASGNEVVRYFGCWLDINQTQPQFPLNPSPADGPYSSSSRRSIQELVRNQHQCLAAEIAFDSAPIPVGASPSSSDKLAQRNLAIVESANPGMIASHRISHTFEIKPSKVQTDTDESPDELMIVWGNTPLGSIARLFLPGVSTNDILRLASSMYRLHSLVRIDGHTLLCESGGITYIPIPRGEGSSYTGLLSVDLPDTVKADQVFTIVVHQVTRIAKARPVLTHETSGTTIAGKTRRISGTFQITIPVRHKENILTREARLLSNLRWISGTIPVSNRWYPVFSKYIRHIADRVNALGGKEKDVFPSPSDDWNRARKRCRWLAVLAALLLAGVLASAGVAHYYSLGSIPVILVILFAVVLRFWRKKCRPGACKILISLMIGSAAAVLVLLLLLLLKVMALQLVAILAISAAFALSCFIAAWIKGCLKKS
ncbi:MAG TPA: hypothetical protein VMC08_05085, partial [Bacteroidales bacterium]|nr:hypothetical protein [Bacteroidales bacterium]